MQKRLLLALSKRELNDFLPSPLSEEIESLFECVHFDTESSNSAAYHQKLKTFSPEVVITGWETPSLPEYSSEEAPTELKYLCHVAGAVRSKVPRSYIENGLIVSNWGSVISRTVAECGLLLILSCLRQLNHWSLTLHVEKSWQTNVNYEENYSLFGRTVGLHGFGGISRELVKLLKPFDVTLMAYSPSVPDEDFKAADVQKASTLEELFRESQVLVELASATPKNFHIVNKALLESLPEKACFINIGRGAVVDEAALAEVAQKGELQIGLDVYETEPLPSDSPLRGLKNVTLLPHIGGPTRDRRVDCGHVALNNLKNYLQGKDIENTINLQIYDRIT